MIDAVITSGLAVVTSTATGLATFLFTRKKYKSEVAENEIHNMSESLSFYIKLVEDNKKQLDDYKSELKSYRKEISELRQENSDLRKQIYDLQKRLITN